MNNTAISAGHELTAETASDILLSGGNAVDAAIAAFLVAWIAEPFMATGGGGAFANIYSAKGEAYLFDFFCQTPLKKRPANELDFYPVEIDFGDATETFHIGKGSSAVPGSVAGIFAMHRHFGTIPMKELVKPAIQAAKEGVIINNFQALDFALLEPIVKAAKTATPLSPNGNILKKGDLLQMPALADFLDYMGQEGENAFYKGEIATKIVQQHRENGGLLTQADLDNYQVIIRKPLAYNYQQHTILTNPLPSLGGSILVLLLHHLGEIKNNNPKSYEHIQAIYKAMQQTVRVGTNGEQLAHALQQILPDFSYPNSPTSNRHGSTSHFNIVDKWGNAVALTTTIGEGSADFIAGTDIHMNNMLGEASLQPNGFHTWIPNTRLSSMMSPTIVLDELQKPKLITGSGGASRIPFVLGQVIINLLNYNLSLEEAVESPRLHLEHQTFNIEHGFDASAHQSDFQDKLLLWTSKSMFFGGAHSIYRQGNRFYAQGDNRRDGVGLIR